MQVSIMIARFPGIAGFGGWFEHPDTTDWLVKTCIQAKSDPRVSDVIRWRDSDTPIFMCRNKAIETAIEAKADILFMIDADMKPDAYHPANKERLGTSMEAVPFYEAAMNFLLEHSSAREPKIIAAPYCGPPPWENIFVFQWCNKQSAHPNPNDFRLEQYSREEAAVRTGVEEVAAIGTGLIAFDVRAFSLLDPPYCDYEWTDKRKIRKASTEDVVLTRDLSLAGAKVYCHWNTWAGHWKPKCVGKPEVVYVDNIQQKLRDAIQRNRLAAERIVEVGTPGNDLENA